MDHSLMLLLDAGCKRLSHCQQTDGYFSALQAFWQKDGEKSQNIICQNLSKEELEPLSFSFYRLWIEILWLDQDFKSLRELERHIISMGLEHPDHMHVFIGLRATIALLTDAKETLEDLTIRNGFRQSEFGLDVLDRKALFCGSNDPEGESYGKLNLLSFKDGPTDYFSWVTLFKYSLIHFPSDAPQIAKKIHKAFPKAPIASYLKYYVNLESKSFKKATGAIRSINQSLSIDEQNHENLFLEGYALYQSRQPKKALGKLLHVMRDSEGNLDPDVAMMLGCTYLDLSDYDIDSSYWDLAKDSFLKARRALVGRGLPATQVHVMLNMMQQEERQLNEKSHGNSLDDLKTPNGWVVDASPALYFDISESGQEKIEHLVVPMGSAPQPDDVVFITRNEDADGGNGNWRLLAIYMVECTPIKHPMHGFETSLRLVTRLTRPLSMRGLIEISEAKEDRYDSRRFAVYPLDSSLMNEISEQLREAREEESLLQKSS